MNPNFNNGYNPYNPEYNPDNNMGGYGGYNTMQSFNTLDNDNNDNGNKKPNSGIFGTLFAIVGLVVLVYILLRLLGIDVLSFVDSSKKDKDDKVKEVVKDDYEDDSKISIKDKLSSYCKSLDSEGNYLIDKIDNDEMLEGNFEYCKGNLCIYGKNSKEEKTILYSYDCKSTIYMEMPKKDKLTEMRADIACLKIDQSGNYEKSLSDGEEIVCTNGICKISNSGESVTKQCPNFSGEEVLDTPDDNSDSGDSSNRYDNNYNDYIEDSEPTISDRS